MVQTVRLTMDIPQLLNTVADVPVVQVQQILRCCLCEDSRDSTVQLVVFVLGQGRCHPCRGADADALGPISIVILHLQYTDKVVEVCCVSPVVLECRCGGDSRAPPVAPR